MKPFVNPVEVHWYNIDPSLRAAYEGRCWSQTVAWVMASFLGTTCALSLFLGVAFALCFGASLIVPVGAVTYWVVRRRLMQQAYAERSA